MAYYDALVAKWATLDPGTTDQKLTQINAITVTGAVPTTFTVTGDQLANCINWAEFAALTATQQANLLALCSTPGQLLGGSANVTHLAPGMFLAYFTNLSGPTIIALTALAKAQVQTWWQSVGMAAMVSKDDLIKAGNLT